MTLPDPGTIKGIAQVIGTTKEKGRLLIAYTCLKCGRKKYTPPYIWKKNPMTLCWYCKGENHPRFTHGHSTPRTGNQSPEYNAWRNAVQRCRRDIPPPRGKPHLDIYEPWRLSFITFLNDMGPLPSGFYRMHRIDPKKGYFPSNCIWKEYNGLTRRKKERDDG